MRGEGGGGGQGGEGGQRLAVLVVTLRHQLRGLHRAVSAWRVAAVHGPATESHQRYL